MDRGFDLAGIKTVLQAEIDPWCLSVLERHWPDVERVTDVRSVGSKREPASGAQANGLRTAAHSGRWEAGARLLDGIDLVYGGFPCQDVSVAGNRAGLGGARSGLWSEFARVVSELRPTWVCVENVPGLLSSNLGRDFGQILSDLDELGYGVAWAILDARYFGVPQRRRRVFIVGCLGNPDAAAAVLAVCESGCGHPAPRRETGEDIAPSLDDGARGTSLDLPMTAFTLPASSRGTGDGHGNAWNSNYIAGSGVSPEAMRPLTACDDCLFCAENPDGDCNCPEHARCEVCGHCSGNHSADEVVAFSVSENQRAETRLTDYARQLTAGGGKPGQGYSTALTSAGVRRLTPRECERLQGWPDDFTRWTADGREIPDSHRYRLCGNGVASPCAEYIGHRLVAVDRMLKG